MNSSLINSYHEKLDDYFSYRLHKSLILYLPPVIFICGIIGNTFAFIILVKKTMQIVSVYVYLLVLSIADSLILVIGLLRLWITHLYQYDVLNEAKWICKLLSVVGYTVSDYSVWLIVAVTIERFVAVTWPLSTLVTNRSSKGVKRAYVVVVALLATLLSINIHLAWTTTIEQKTGSSNVTSFMFSNVTNFTLFTVCTGAIGYHTFVNIIWPWIDAVLYSVLPVILLFILNLFIITKVIETERYRSNQLNAVSSSQSLISDELESDRGQILNRDKRLTVTLLVVSFTFLFTTLPHAILLVVDSFLPVTLSIDTIVLFRLLQTISELFMYVNHAVNFYLYCITGKKFRRQFFIVIRPIMIRIYNIVSMLRLRKNKNRLTVFTL